MINAFERLSYLQNTKQELVKLEAAKKGVVVYKESKPSQFEFEQAYLEQYGLLPPIIPGTKCIWRRLSNNEYVMYTTAWDLSTTQSSGTLYEWFGGNNAMSAYKRIPDIYRTDLNDLVNLHIIGTIAVGTGGGGGTVYTPLPTTNTLRQGGATSSLYKWNGSAYTNVGNGSGVYESQVSFWNTDHTVFSPSQGQVYITVFNPVGFIPNVQTSVYWETCTAIEGAGTDANPRRPSYLVGCMVLNGPIRSTAQLGDVISAFFPSSYAVYGLYDTNSLTGVRSA